MEFLDNGSIGKTSIIGEKTFFIILKTEYSTMYTHYSYNVISDGSFYSILISVYKALFHKKTLLHLVLLNGLPDQSNHQFISSVLKILQAIASSLPPPLMNPTLRRAAVACKDIFCACSL
jgi:hypothetical protein